MATRKAGRSWGSTVRPCDDVRGPRDFVANLGGGGCRSFGPATTHARWPVACGMHSQATGHFCVPGSVNRFCCDGPARGNHCRLSPCLFACARARSIRRLALGVHGVRDLHLAVDSDQRPKTKDQRPLGSKRCLQPPREYLATSAPSEKRRSLRGCKTRARNKQSPAEVLRRRESQGGVSVVASRIPVKEERGLGFRTRFMGQNRDLCVPGAGEREQSGRCRGIRPMLRRKRDVI